MQGKIIRIIALAIFAQIVAPHTTWQARAQQATTLYPTMAPLDQYLIADRSSEITLAQSAAPKTISGDAGIWILGPHGYEAAVKGSNGFECMVLRSWTAGIDDPDFWNPKIRSPICFNPAAVRTYMPIIIMKTRLLLAGESKAQMSDAVNAAIDKKELPPMDPGAMCYMMSKQQYLNDAGKSWHPHLMFFVSHSASKDWGANLDGSPVLAADDTLDQLIIFMIPLHQWSDGTAAP